MPTQSTFGARTNADRDELFAQLKAKGEKITFRVIKTPYYDGKHFTRLPDNKWQIEWCPKIMSDEYCEKCDTYYAKMREVKKLKADKKDNEAKVIEEEAKPFKNKVTFYYPIINRETESVQILKVPQSIRIYFDIQASKGFDITKFDYVMERTEVPGKYYDIDRKDSSMTQPLSEKEQVEWEKGQTILEKLENKRESSTPVGENSMVDAIVGSSEQKPYTPPNPADEPPTIKVDPQSGEVVNPEDIPF